MPPIDSGLGTTRGEQLSQAGLAPNGSTRTRSWHGACAGRGVTRPSLATRVQRLVCYCPVAPRASPATASVPHCATRRPAAEPARLPQGLRLPQGFDFQAINGDGSPATEAGTHPYELIAKVNFNRRPRIPRPARRPLPRRRPARPALPTALGPDRQPQPSSASAPWPSSTPRAPPPSKQASRARAARTRVRSAR